MSHQNLRKKVHETCRYWKEGKCHKGQYQCNFVHGFICENDGRCWKENCNKIHIQKKFMPSRDYFPKTQMNYQRSGPHLRYRRSHSRSPSPPRHRKVPQRGRSPGRWRSRSRSPAYHTRVYSPYQRRSRSSSPARGPRRSRSRSPSPLRGSRRSRSRSLSPFRGPRRSRSRSLSPLRRPRRSRSRSRSPMRGPRRSRSRSLSPLRGQRRSRSRSPSPMRGPRRSRSRSPVPLRGLRRSRSMSRSPIKGARSSSRSVSPPHKRSQSRNKSGPWRHTRSRSRSQNRSRVMSRSKSPVLSKHKSHGLGKLQSRSPSTKLNSKKRPEISTGSYGPNQTSSPSSLKEKNPSPKYRRSKTPVVPETNDDDRKTPERTSSNAGGGGRMQLDLDSLYEDLDCETNQESASSGTVDKEAAQKEAMSILQAQISKDFMNPETQKLMEKVLSLTKENAATSHQAEEGKSKKEFCLDEVGDDIELDLVEVGDELDDIFAKSLNRSVDESNEDAFDKDFSSTRKSGREAGINPSPPKSKSIPNSRKSSDFDDADLHSILTPASKCLKKPPQMPPPNHEGDGSKTGSSSLWTPALIRNQAQTTKYRLGYLPKDNDWEVDTPYVGRKDRSEVQRLTAPTKTVINEQQSCDESPAASFVLPAAEPSKTQKNSNKFVHVTTLENHEKANRQKDMLFPSAQSVVSNISVKTSQTFSQAGVTSIGQGPHVTGMMPSCASDLREVSREKQSYYSPKEHPKKSVEEQTPSKPSESPKRSNRKHHKEKKPKRKKDSSSDDSSESDDSKEDKILPREKEKDSDELEVLLFKKESLMKRVKLLMEQQDMMSSQREGIINNHRGSKASLSSILEENSFLIKEIGKQIDNINSIVKSINHDIEVKTANLKQTSASKRQSESPHGSRDSFKTTIYSAEKERVTKKVIKSVERLDASRASPCQERRVKSPYRSTRRSPSPLQRPNISEVERKSLNRDDGPRSPKSLRHKRSNSPSPSVSRGGPKPVTPERKQVTSPSRKHPGKSNTEVMKKPTASQQSQYLAPKRTDALPYAPHAAQRTFIRYMDQGMHWCKLCSLFCETVPEYVDHLMTESHLGRVKNDRKTWLSRAPKEEKEPKPPNAQVMTVPIQGLEFLHSLPSYYCSLCDTFMRDKGEALRHPESKLHVSKYKVHRAQNPLFEPSFLKAKTSAYAKYKVDEERKKMENELSLNEKNVLLENKLLKQIKGKIEEQKEQKKEQNKQSKEQREDFPSESQDDSGRNCGSIRVASRGPRHSSDKKQSGCQSRQSSDQKPPREDAIPRSHDASKRKSESVANSKEPQKCELKEAERVDNNASAANVQEKISVEDQKVSKLKEGLRDTDTDRKPVSTKLPLIGKMPFLKRKSVMTKKKEQHNIPAEEPTKIRSESTEEFSSPKEIPLPNTETRDSDVGNASQKVEEVKEMPLPIKPVAPPVTSVEVEAMAVTKSISLAPLLPEGEKASEDEAKDTHGSDLYDPLEAGNEDSSDGVAAATIEALDLLNIPLPGFKGAPDSQKSSEMSMLSDTEDKYQPEDMEIESTPLILEGEGIVEGKILENSSCPMEEVHSSSGMLVHPHMPHPSMVMAPPPVNLNNPPPLNLNIPPPPINLNNPPPTINVNNPPPMNLNPPLPVNLNNPPPPINLNTPPPINLNNPPPPVNLSTSSPIGLNNPSMSLNHPPPPGTEDPDFNLSGKINVPTGNMLPVYGPQEFISRNTPSPMDMQRLEDQDILMPPGTEDEYNTRDIPAVSYSSGKHMKKVDEIDTQEHYSHKYIPKKKSLDVPLSFSDNIIKGSLRPMADSEPSKIQEKDKASQQDRENETTPPPPGTEGSPTEIDSYVINESSKVYASDLEMDALKSPSVSSMQEICTSQERKSSYNVLECESSSNRDQVFHPVGKVFVSAPCEKNSSYDCLRADAKLEEVGSYPTSDVRSHTSSPKKPNNENIVTSGSSSEKYSCASFKEPDSEGITPSPVNIKDSSCTLSSKETEKGNVALLYGQSEESSTTFPKDEKSSTTHPKNEESSTSLLKDEESSIALPKDEECSITLLKDEERSTILLRDEESSTTLPKDEENSITLPKDEERSIILLKDEENFITLPNKESDTEKVLKYGISSSSSSNRDQVSHSVGNLSESVQYYEKNTFSEFLKADAKQEPDSESITPSTDSTKDSFCTLSSKEAKEDVSHGKSEESCTTLPNKKYDTENEISLFRSHEGTFATSAKQLDSGKIITSYDSQKLSFKPQDQHSSEESIADSQSMMSKLNTVCRGQTATRNIISPWNSEKQLPTLIMEQSDSGNITSCLSEEKLSIPLAQPPDTDMTITHGNNVERCITNPPEIITRLQQSEELAKQPPAETTAASHEANMESHFMSPKEFDGGNKAMLQEAKEKSYPSLASEPDITLEIYDSVDKQFSKSDLQPATENIIDTSPDCEEAQVCSPPTLLRSTASLTTSQDKDESIESSLGVLSPKGHDTENIPSSSKLSVSQDSDGDSVFKECTPNDQDSNSLSSLKVITEDSTECCDPMNEANLTDRNTVIDKCDSPVINSKSPTHFIDFHKGFESMDINNLYFLPTSDTVSAQSMNTRKVISPQTENKNTSVTFVKTDEETSEIVQGRISSTEEINKPDDCNYEVRISEAKPIQDPVHDQNKESLADSLETSIMESSDSCKDYASSVSTDSEAETLPHEISDEGDLNTFIQKVQKESYNKDGTSQETEEVTVGNEASKEGDRVMVEESAAVMDKTCSSEDESVYYVDNTKGKRKRQSTRKTTRTSIAKVDYHEEDDCTPSRTSASRSSSKSHTLSVIESPRPMRSSRRAAAAAIKAIVKNQDDTPPDSPPSDDDADY